MPFDIIVFTPDKLRWKQSYIVHGPGYYKIIIKIVRGKYLMYLHLFGYQDVSQINMNIWNIPTIGLMDIRKGTIVFDLYQYFGLLLLCLLILKQAFKEES